MLEIITGAIGLLLYPLFAVIFNILDLLQSVFYGLAGIGEIGFGNAKMPNGEIIGSIGSANDGGETSTGLIYYLLTSDLIKNLFSSIVILALFLIIIFTAMAFIKNAYSSKQKNWQEIVGNAFKGLANFIFIPVCCLLGVWLSNILLLAINGATSNGGATMMSRKLFVSSAYEANLYRQDDIKNLSEKEAEALQTWAIGQGLQDVKVQANVNDSEYYAEIVDRVYAETNISIYRGKLVEQHYKLFAINYLTIVVGGVFMLYVLVSLAYAMIKRMFILLMLFVISPAICAMYPIDEGSAVGNWKKEFIKYTISAFGTVAAMNLFFSILPIVENIELVAGWGPWFNDIFQLLIMVSGLFVVKEFMGTLSNWIGGDNALTTGESLKKSASGALKKYATGTVKTIGAFQKARGRASAAKEAWKESHLKEGKDHLNFGQWIGKQFVGLGSMGKQGLDAGLKGVDKAALGGEAEKLFGWGHDETGKKRKSLFQQGAKAEKERMATIKTEDETERQKKLFLKGDEKKGIESGIKKFSKEFGNATTDLEKNEIMARYFEEGEDSNVSVAELEKEALKFSGLDIQDIRKMKREGVRQLNRLEYSGLESSDSSTSTTTPATPVGGRSIVEDTMMERKEIKVLEEIRDLLKGNGKGSGGMSISEDALLKLAKANAMSAAADGAISKAMKEVLDNHAGGTQFANRLKAKMEGGSEISVESMGLHTKTQKASFEANETQINSYNAALQAKENAEKMAKEATAALIKEFENAAKGNKVAEKAVEEFAKSMKTSVKDIEEFAKKLNEILKK